MMMWMLMSLMLFVSSEHPIEYEAMVNSGKQNGNWPRSPPNSCWYCEKTGHFNTTCTNPQSSNSKARDQHFGRKTFNKWSYENAVKKGWIPKYTKPGNCPAPKDFRTAMLCFAHLVGFDSSPEPMPAPQSQPQPTANVAYGQMQLPPGWPPGYPGHSADSAYGSAHSATPAYGVPTHFSSHGQMSNINPNPVFSAQPATGAPYELISLRDP